MSWCGGGEISDTPGVAWRRRAISSVTLKPGSWPPSPGLAPWATLISSSLAAFRYSAVTPKRPEATCLIGELALSPLGRGLKRSAPSPPSPESDRAPMRFMAMVRVSCASGERAPKDMPGVTKRFLISVMLSTSSSGTGGSLRLKSSRSRIEIGSWAWSMST